jgi:tetratricopeptide (TPR) repeat protein
VVQIIETLHTPAVEVYVKNFNKFLVMKKIVWIKICVGIIAFCSQYTFGQIKTIRIDDARSSTLMVYEGVEQGIDGYLEAAGMKFEKALQYNWQNYIALSCHLLIEDILDGRISKNQGAIFFEGIDAWIYANPEKAQSILNSLSQDLNDYWILYFYRGLNEESLQEYDEAFRYYIKVIDLRPTFFYTYIRRGRIFARKKRFNMAINDFNQSIELDSTHHAAYYERGTVYQEIGEYKKSIADYERAYYLYPPLKQTLHKSIKICEGYNNLGMKNMQSEDYPEALRNFTDAINWNRNFHEPYLNRGIVYRHLHLLEAAIADFNRVLALDTAYVEAYYNLALVYKQKDELERTLDYLNLAKEINPVHVPTYQLLGETYYKLRQFDLAIEMFEIILSLDSKNYWGYYWVALSYDVKRKYPQAIQAYETFIKIAPEDYYEQKVKMYERAERLKRWMKKLQR